MRRALLYIDVLILKDQEYYYNHPILLVLQTKLATFDIDFPVNYALNDRNYLPVEVILLYEDLMPKKVDLDINRDLKDLAHNCLYLKIAQKSFLLLHHIQ